MHVNVRSVGVGRVGVCMLCVDDSQERGVGAGVNATLKTFLLFIFSPSLFFLFPSCRPSTSGHRDDSIQMLKGSAPLPSRAVHETVGPPGPAPAKLTRDERRRIGIAIGGMAFCGTLSTFPHPLSL